jgi:hypothetical protein
MATEKKSDDQGGVAVKTDTRERHPDGVPVQVPETADSTDSTPAKTATKKGS